MGIRIGDWDFGLGLSSGIGVLELGYWIRIGHWGLGLGIGDWDLGLRIGDWNLGFGLGIGANFS